VGEAGFILNLEQLAGGGKELDGVPRGVVSPASADADCEKPN